MMGFTAKIEPLADASFYPDGVTVGMPAVTIRHDDGPWTTAAYTSIDAMHRLPVFAQFEIDGVRIVLAESVTNGATHKADGSRDEWTRPAMAYAGEADLLTFGRQIGGGKTLTYILPKPVSKPAVPRPYDTAPFPDPPPHASPQRDRSFIPAPRHSHRLGDAGLERCTEEARQVQGRAQVESLCRIPDLPGHHRPV